MSCADEKSFDQLVQEKRAANLAKIPKEWLLPEDCGIAPSEINPSSTRCVIDIPRTCGILTPEELELTEDHDATDLLKLMREGVVKSEDVVRTFCKRAAVAHQLTNCLSEIMFEEALARARELDAYFASTGPVGPLHGLPVSLKDSFNMKGTYATLGYVAYLRRPPAESESAVVEILKSLGAIPFVKTNIPQAMMSAETENNVFGRTMNPNRLCLTAGGSTGGEGVLIRMRGSVLGVATDVAGSCRIPALCCGVIGFKPTAGRIPFTGGVLPGRAGSPSAIIPVIGPEGRSIRDMELFMKVIIETDPWKVDSSVIAAAWQRPREVKLRLNLGYIMEDKEKRPLHPPQLKMMTSLLDKIQEGGHAVIPIEKEVPGLYETSLLAWKYFLLDPQKTVVKILQSGNEKFLGGLLTTKYPELENWAPSLDELWDMNVARANILRTYHDLIVQHDLDGIVLPTYQATAVPHDTYGLVLYTVLANFLDYPTIAMPFLRASQEEDKAFVRDDVSYSPPYTPELVEGAPCGFQIMGRPMRDEDLLQAATIIENCLGGDC